jgi:hypothetical protein
MFYTFGISIKYNPVIIINLKKMNDYYRSTKDEEKILISAYNMLHMIQYNMLSEGKVESWVVIMDASNLSLFKLPVSVITFSIY